MWFFFFYYWWYFQGLSEQSFRSFFVFLIGRNFNDFSHQWFLSVGLDSSRQGIEKCGIAVTKSQCNCHCEHLAVVTNTHIGN